MVRVTSKSIDILSTYVNLATSVALIGISICLHFSDNNTLCFKVIEKPLLIVGVPVLLLSVFDLVGSLCRVKFMLWTCVILWFLIYLGIICLTVFSILVTNKNVSRALFGRDGNYSHYLLEKYVMNAGQIKNCLVDFEICQPIPTGKGAYFSPTQSSCCKPPTYCGLEFHNATYWTMTKAGPAVANNDCKIWNNVQSELCFKCQSCKTTFYDNIKTYWKILSIINFVVLLCFSCIQCYVLMIWIKNRSKGQRTHKVYPV